MSQELPPASPRSSEHESTDECKCFKIVNVSCLRIYEIVFTLIARSNRELVYTPASPRSSEHVRLGLNKEAKSQLSSCRAPLGSTLLVLNEHVPVLSSTWPWCSTSSSSERFIASFRTAADSPPPTLALASGLSR